MTDKELRQMGVEDAYVRNEILKALEEEKKKDDDLLEELDAALAELETVKKQAAVEKAILEAGGKHVKAILGMIDMDEVTFDEKKGLKGLDMDEIKEEVPYLFHEKKEKKKGTGLTKGSKKKREDEIRAAFWGLK